MRYDVRTPQELKDAVAEITDQDRLVIFAANGEASRFRLAGNTLKKEPCHANGDLAQI